MGCVYSLVQYALDTLGDDRLTVGMIAIDEDGSHAATAFIEKWARARCFGGGDTGFLEDFVHELSQRAGVPGKFTPPEITIEELEEMARDYQNAIRVSSPTRVDMAASEWIRDYAQLFVSGLGEKRQRETARTTVNRIIRDTKQLMAHVLQAEFHIPDASHRVRPAEIIGEFGQMRVIPAAIRNEIVHFGSIAATLDHEPKDVQARVDQTVETIRDIRTRISGTPLIVVIDDFSTERISRRQREVMENQLRAKCKIESVDVIRSDHPDLIADHIREAMTPSALEALAHA